MKNKEVILPFFFSLFFLSTVTNTPVYETDKSVKIQKIDLKKKYKSNGYVNVIKISKNSASYQITNKDHRKYDFYVNANYFTIKNEPVGEVKILGRVLSKKNKGGGFFTSNGKIPRFYFQDRPKDVIYSIQTHTPIIINGKPNYQIFNKKWAKYKLPRLVIGENKSGDIFVIHTIENARCSVSDFYTISKDLELINVLMLDGGASIEVGLSYKNMTYKYQIVSDLQRKLGKVPTPSVFIVANFN